MNKRPRLTEATMHYDQSGRPPFKRSSSLLGLLSPEILLDRVTNG